MLSDLNSPLVTEGNEGYLMTPKLRRGGSGRSWQAVVPPHLLWRWSQGDESLGLME